MISGAVALSGTGTVALSNIAGPAAFASESITSVSTGGTLDHLGGTISGYGEIVGAKLALINEKGATVEASGGNLVISTGTAVSNLGLLEAVGGDLLLQSPVTNGGTILAGAAGVVSVQTTVTNTGLVSALNAGIVVVQGNVTGAAGTVTTAAGGMIELDHGTLNGGTLNNAAKGTVEVTTNGGTLTNISVVNAGVVTLVGNSTLSQISALHIVGSVQLTGGGLVSLSDSSGSALASSQMITGAVAGDTLDNVDNTISGYGLLGNGLMTLKNETSGTIDAIGGTLVVNTGTNAVVNTGLLEAATSSVLDLSSDITNTGGTIDANGGAVDLDRMSVIGGTLTTENGGTIHVTGSAALAGIAGPVTLTLASHLEVDSGQTLTLEGIDPQSGHAEPRRQRRRLHQQRSEQHRIPGRFGHGNPVRWRNVGAVRWVGLRSPRHAGGNRHGSWRHAGQFRQYDQRLWPARQRADDAEERGRRHDQRSGQHADRRYRQEHHHQQGPA